MVRGPGGLPARRAFLDWFRTWSVVDLMEQPAASVGRLRMTSHRPAAPESQEEMRQRVLENFAALFENQTRNRRFAASVTEMTQNTHAAVAGGLRAAIQQTRPATEQGRA